MPTKDIARGTLAQAPISKHPILAGCDKSLAWTMILAFLGFEIVGCAVSAYTFRHGVTAYGIMNVASSFCTLSIAALSCIVWHTYCYYDPRMRSLMTYKTRFTPNGFMKAGFFPIPAAASVGLLLFVTSAIVSPSVMEGGMLQAKTAGIFLAWLPDMTCRASSIEDAGYGMSWTGRMDRSAPIPWRESITAYMDPEARKSTPVEGACFHAPFEFGQGAVMADGADLDVPDLIHPMGDTEGRICMYQCVLWKEINLQAIIGQIGGLAVGAAIVVSLTESISSKFGLPVVSSDTSPAELADLFERLAKMTAVRSLTWPFRTSKAYVAFPLIAISYLLKLVVVSKINADGYYTVDYYVVFALLYSVVMVSIMRKWHFYECRPALFTRKLWSEGVETFIVRTETWEEWKEIYGANEFKKIKDVTDHLVLIDIDLYQWMHIRQQERAALLINHCRRPDRSIVEGNSPKLVALGKVPVKLSHKVDFGCGEKVTSLKTVTLEGGTELTQVAWKDETQVVVKATLNGVEEQFTMSKLEVLEKSAEWDKKIASLKGIVDYSSYAELLASNTGAVPYQLLKNYTSEQQVKIKSGRGIY